LIGTGASTVLVYDSHLAGKMFYGQFAYKLTTPVSVAGATTVLLNAPARTARLASVSTKLRATAGEITTLNSHKIAGPGS